MQSPSSVRALAVLTAVLLSACAASEGSVASPTVALRSLPFARETRAPSEEVRTLAQALAVALDRNPSLALAEARMRSSEAALRQARAALWPTAGADLALTWADAPSVFLFKSIDARSLAPNTDFNHPGSLANTELGLSVGWNLWRGGRDELAIESAKLGVQAEASAESAQRNALIAMVVAVWLDHRAARELQASDEARIRTLEEQQSAARARFDSGAALEVDVLALDVRLAQAREARTRSELAARLALAALRELLALGQHESLAPSLETPTALVAAATHAAALDLALEQRAELRTARAALAAAHKRLRASNGAWSPRLDLQGRVWGDDTDVGLDFEDPNAALTLSLSFDALDGGRRSAGVDSARADVLLADAQSRSVELAVAHDVERAWIGIEGARSRLVVAEQALHAADRGAQIVASQLASGAATTSRYLDAEADLARARAEHVLACIDVQRASFDLLRATGSMESMSW